MYLRLVAPVGYLRIWASATPDSPTGRSGLQEEAVKLASFAELHYNQSAAAERTIATMIIPTFQQDHVLHLKKLFLHIPCLSLSAGRHSIVICWRLI